VIIFKFFPLKIIGQFVKTRNNWTIIDWIIVFSPQTNRTTFFFYLYKGI